MGNNFGRLFRMTTFGESHGDAVGVIVDGCPAQLPLSVHDIQADLDRRRPGQSEITTARTEDDHAEILSGVFEDKTLGTPITILVQNNNMRSKDYDNNRTAYRPSHADYTYDAKFGFRDYRGGGRASAREAIGRVAAGAIAKKILHHRYNIDVVAYVTQIGHLKADINPEDVTPEAIEATAVRCPDPAMAISMIAHIKEMRKAGDSIGGVITCDAKNVPPGLGEPVFDKLEAVLGHAMLSIPACKAFEVGSGFRGSNMRGSEHNDLFYKNSEGRICTRTNYSGGIQGGISNGETIVMRLGFKPTATIMQPQETVDQLGQTVMIEGRGRHDPCVLPRAVPIVEAMASMVLLDQIMRHDARKGIME